MRCSHVKKRLNAYIDRELPEALRAAVETHLAGCEGCRRDLERMESVSLWLDAAPPPPAVPSEFADRLMAQARRQVDASRAARPSAVLPWPARLVSMRLAAAAMIAIGLGLGAWMGSDLSRQAARATSAEADPLASYSLDYFADAPAGSLVSAYLALSSGSNGNGG